MGGAAAGDGGGDSVGEEKCSPDSSWREPGWESSSG